MTVGFSTSLVNDILNAICNGIPFTTPGNFVGLHTGDPGLNGTSNLSVMTLRKIANFGTPINGLVDLTTSLTWVMTATETITHLSVWSSPAGGSFYWSTELPSPITKNSGETLTLNACQLTIGPLAA